MVHRLIIFHHARESGESIAFPMAGEWFGWETCLRQINISWNHYSSQDFQSEPGWDLYQGVEAYQFLVEIICGLHSPIIGETEVLGQFRSHAEAALLKFSPKFAAMFQRLLQNLYKDAKNIRGSFFKNTGSQSYGSFTRRALKDRKQIQIIGAGQLVAEILPWIADPNRSVSVFCRNPARVQEMAEKFIDVKFLPLSDFTGGLNSSAIIIAAPLSASEIQRIIGSDFSADNLLIDFRADSARDCIAFSGKVFTLADIFQDLEASGTALESRVHAARKKIEVLARKHIDRVEHRPFGWEDVCA